MCAIGSLIGSRDAYEVGGCHDGQGDSIVLPHVVKEALEPPLMKCRTVSARMSRFWARLGPSRPVAARRSHARCAKRPRARPREL